MLEAYERLLAGDNEDREPPRRGDDLTLIHPVAFLAALRGERVELLTPTGRHAAVTLPTASVTGTTLRLAGLGGAGSPPGDLLLQLLVLDDTIYRRSPSSSHTLERTWRVTWLEAWRGDTVEVETPWGTTWIDLRAGTRDGQVYEIPAHGVRSSAQWGPLRLTMQLEPPPAPLHLTPETAEALRSALEAAFQEGQC